MQIKHFSIIGVALFIIVVLLVIGRASDSMREEIEYYKRRQAQYEQTISDIRFKLYQSQQFRSDLVSANRALHSANENLLRERSVIKKELDALKGKFDQMNSGELQNEMIKQYENQ